VLLQVLPVAAKRTIALEEPIKIRLEIEQITGVIFPEPISSATRILPKERMEVGERGALLFLAPYDPTIPKGRMFVVGQQTGTVYPVYYELVATKGDDEVYISRATPTAKKTDATPETLMRALLAAPHAPLALPGVKAHDNPTPFLPVPPAEDLRVILRSSRLESVGGMYALRVQLENGLDMPLMLDYRVGQVSTAAGTSTVVLDRWVWPPKYDLALLVLDQDILPAHGTTTLYVIYKERQ
jgi:hypothetical protein